MLSFTMYLQQYDVIVTWPTRYW